ncbi:hypothetical protein O1611_g2274 [Lasiodiplodia mahajangana]|uniref:Uncharacterized protein n=1 Tax=Lasiodiplodia mahajangana TaxID=1108764 RepID=A0ACC2JVQ5_9PEZI|nr:hypothetical protein O1611_g2274 [Lasiodiplodia mahajangana]
MPSPVPDLLHGSHRERQHDRGQWKQLHASRGRSDPHPAWRPGSRVRDVSKEVLTAASTMYNLHQPYNHRDDVEHLLRPDASGYTHPLCHQGPTTTEEKDHFMLHIGGWRTKQVLTAIYVGNIPLCWPIVQRVFGKGAWAKPDDESDPNQPRTSSGKSPLRKRPFHNLLSGTITGLDQTNFDRTGDANEHNESRVRSTRIERPASENSKETIALTPDWHHNSNSTTVFAGASAGSTNGSTTREDGVSIVRTVEVSREERCEPVPAGIEVESTTRSSLTGDLSLRSEIV